jgi:Lamin Tail Domain
MRTRNLLHHAVALWCLLTPAGAAPILTEFLASNQTGLTDEDGNRPDWIEIFNPDGVAVDLGGYRLTDNAGLPAKWIFPAGAIVQPGGYLVVFASGLDRTTIGSPLHTSFSLNASGEYLAFADPDGVILSQWAPVFPAQTADVSYGVISTTPGAASAYFNTPTPGAANNPATAPAEPVAFSLTSRTFNAGQTLNVALSVTSPSATIRYTTDRSVPTAGSGICP